MPVPSAVISVPICSLDSILSVRTRSTLRILPRSGSTAWNSRLRPILALPPALSPSTMNSSDLAGSFSWQSASLPGSEETLSGFFRVSSRAFRAASRAAAAWITLPTMTLASAGCSSNHAASASLITFSTTGRTSEDTSLSLVCDENFGSGTFTESTCEAFAAIVAGQCDLLFFRVGLGIAVDLTGQRAAETGQMRAAVALRDIVGEAQHVLMIAVVPPKRRLDADAVRLRPHHDRRGYHRLLVAVEILHELLDAADIAHLLALLDRVAHVGEHDIDAGIQERELAQAMLQRRKIIFDVGEGLGRGLEGHLGAALALGLADHFQRRHRIAVGEFDEMLLAVAPDFELQLAGQRVDHRDADAVQAARNLVGVLVEFTAGMQLGHDDLGSGNAFALVDVDRYAATVVAHRDGIVGVEDDFDQGGVAGERLVDRVVDDLV